MKHYSVAGVQTDEIIDLHGHGNSGDEDDEDGYDGDGQVTGKATGTNKDKSNRKAGKWISLEEYS